MDEEQSEIEKEVDDWCDEISFETGIPTYDIRVLYPVCAIASLSKAEVIMALNVIHMRWTQDSKQTTTVLRRYIFERVRALDQVKRNEKDNQRRWNRFKKFFGWYKDKSTKVVISPNARMPMEEIMMLNNVLKWSSIGRITNKKS